MGLGLRVKKANRSVSAGSQSFNSSGVFTVPTGVHRVTVYVIGGGGGGGGYYYSSASYEHQYCGGGGGSGDFVTRTLDVVPHQQIAVTIGAGGRAPTEVTRETSSGYITTGSAGGNGYASSFGNIVANGGYGGGYSENKCGVGGNGTAGGGGGSMDSDSGFNTYHANGGNGGSNGSAGVTSQAYLYHLDGGVDTRVPAMDGAGGTGKSTATSIHGTLYCGGGGGGYSRHYSGGTGGAGGGGNGGASGSANTGGGAGGAGIYHAPVGGTGFVYVEWNEGGL